MRNLHTCVECCSGPVEWCGHEKWDWNNGTHLHVDTIIWLLQVQHWSAISNVMATANPECPGHWWRCLHLQSAGVQPKLCRSFRGACDCWYVLATLRCTEKQLLNSLLSFTHWLIIWWGLLCSQYHKDKKLLLCLEQKQTSDHFFLTVQMYFKDINIGVLLKNVTVQCCVCLCDCQDLSSSLWIAVWVSLSFLLFVVSRPPPPPPPPLFDLVTISEHLNVQHLGEHWSDIFYFF